MKQPVPKKSSAAPRRRRWSIISERTGDEALTGLARTIQCIDVAAEDGGFD
jgi:hypothetical protein